jgi:DNA primase
MSKVQELDRLISGELIEAVRALSSIEHVIGEHTQLRRCGVELRGRCLFHSDKTPSLYIRPTKGVFHCHGCGVGGDVFEFVRLLHHCSFRQSMEFLAARAGIRIDGFTPSPELTAKVSELKAQREDELAFKRFCDERITAINQRYRSLGRSATHAEDYLRTGSPDSYLHDLAWDALKRFIDFETRIEREGLCDLDILKTEWSKLHAAA